MLKTKSAVKKRFRLRGNGSLLRAHACKKHNLRKRSMDMKRASRGMTGVHKADVARVKHWLPYGL